jgi:hypothetical protein
MATAANGFSLDPEKHLEPIPGINEKSIQNGSVVPEEILKHSHDADDALKAFASYPGQVVQLDEETSRRLLRKIDWHIMPVSGCLRAILGCLVKVRKALYGYVNSDYFDSCCVSFMG